MEHLPNNLTLQIPHGAFPLSTDSMVLSHFVKLPRNAKVLDLGSGCGTLGLLLCAADSNCSVTGIELTALSHEAAEENIHRNQLSHRLKSICADLRNLPESIIPGSFDICLSNPPYFSSGPASTQTPLARREDCCTLEDLFRSAARALKYGGDFYLVHKPERLAQLIACGASVGLEAKHLKLVHHKEGGPVTLILLRFRKGGKPGLILEELSLFDSQGDPTVDYREIYHI